MNKRGTTVINSVVIVVSLLFLIVVGFLFYFTLNGAGFYSVIYGDNGIRTLTTEARLDEQENLVVEYTLNAAKNTNQYSQSMMMLVKVNDEWLSADAQFVLYGGSYARTVTIPQEELLDKNVVEFYYKVARSHHLDRGDVTCWTRPDHRDPSVPDAPRKVVDDQVASWMKSLTGGDDYLVIGDSQYGVRCNSYFPSGGYITVFNDLVYIERQGYTPDPAVTSITLLDLFDEKVTTTNGFAVERQVVYAPTIDEPDIIIDEPDIGFWAQIKMLWKKIFG